MYVQQRHMWPIHSNGIGGFFLIQAGMVPLPCLSFCSTDLFICFAVLGWSFELLVPLHFLLQFYMRYV